MDVYDELIRLRKLGQKCAIATIVQVRGSIPSFESAKLLVREGDPLDKPVFVERLRIKSPE